jgi:hypothetical protein
MINLLKTMLSFNHYFVDWPSNSHDLPTFGEFMHIIPHNLLTYDIL